MRPEQVMRPQRLTFVLPTFSLSGGVQVIARVAGGLADRGHDVHLAGLGRVNPVVRQWAGPNVQIVAPSLPRAAASKLLERVLGATPARVPESDLRVRRLLDCVEPGRRNVATSWHTAYAVAARAPEGASYYMQHDEQIMESQPLARLQARLTFHLPLRRIANSSWLAAEVERDTGMRPPIVVPGVDAATFAPGDAPPDREPIVLTFNDRRVWKGFDDVLDALGRVSEARPDVQFVSFGSKRDNRQPRGGSLEYRIGLTGRDLAALYRTAAVYIQGSWAESSPLQPLEAMACGTPVVCTPNGTEDYADAAGSPITVVPVRDPGRMSEAVLELLGDETRRAALSARGLALARSFTWERTIDRAEALLCGPDE
jgi:glycosyltransferase involved in cell wall biosynthesis